MKKKNIIVWFSVLISVFLEALPYGAKLKFGLDNGEIKEEFFSYFSLTPYGYANFLPFITAVLTCVLFVMSLVLIFRNYAKLKKAFIILAVITFAVSIISFVFMNFTVTAAFISLMLAFVWLSSQHIYKA